ncbi:MAG: efflux transporter outer membrane subunit [Verrucomicrobiota bacterium]
MREALSERLYAFLPLLSLFFLGGCITVGPDYEAPEISLPDSWQSPYERNVGETKANQESYWLVFNDSVLNEVIERVGKQNRDLRAALAAIDEARASLGIASSERFPSIAVDGSATFDRTSVNVSPVESPIRDRDDTTFSIGPNASWEIDLFGRVRRSIESASASFEASEAQYADLLVILYAETAQAYFDFRAVQQRLEFATSNVTSQENTLNLTVNRVKAGLAPELDRAQAELNLNRSRALLPQLREARDNLLNALAVLTGDYPWDLAPLLGTEYAEQDSIPIVSVTTVPADLLRQRPDIRQAERNLAAQTAQIGVATADLYPRFSLNGVFTFDAFDAQDWFNGDSRAFSIGPFMSWRVFEFGRLRDLIQVEEARTDQALAQYEQTVLTAIQEVEDSLSGLANERRRNGDLRRASEAAEESVRLSLDLYRSGLVEFDTVLTSEQALLELQDSLAESNGIMRQNIVQFYRSIGGGFGIRSPEDPDD